MYGYHTLWRRKRMRCAIASCLGISALVSLLMVIAGSNSAHSLLQEREVQDYHVNFKDVRLHHADPGLKPQTSQNVFIQNQARKVSLKGQKFNQEQYDTQGDGGYDNRDNGGEEDGGYYGNDEPDTSHHDNKIPEVVKVHRPTKKQAEGFVMEDNAADYNRDYDDDKEEDYRGEGYEENEDNGQVNRAFRPGDFDYSLLNKTNKPRIVGKIQDYFGNKTRHNGLGARSRDDQRNNSLVYGATQYKSMHLLENNSQKQGAAADRRHRGPTHNISRGNRVKTLSNVHDNIKSEQHVNLKIARKAKHQQMQSPSGHVRGDSENPCMSDSNCQISGNHKHRQGEHKKQDKKKFSIASSSVSQAQTPKSAGNWPPKGENLRSHKLLTSNIHHKEPKLKTGVKNSLNTGDLDQTRAPVDRNYRGGNGPGVQRNPFVGQNVVVRQRIETQIPIQDGGVDANWLLQEQPATQIQMPELPWQPGEVRSPEGIPLIVDKIFWSKEVEDLIPQGISNEDFQHFLHKLNTTPVKEMHPPQWNRCGRPRNQYVVLADRTQLCARYREEHVKLLHGEVLSFYFSRILGLDNVPIVVLSEANSGATQWQGMNVTGAGWNESSVVALIQWVDGLDSEKSRVKMPSAILEAFENGGVFDHHHKDIHNLQANNLTELVQWSDMILFDYLTGHYDRVASMQDGADREHKPSIMHESIRNLRKVWQTSKMWLIDNESGLLDGYELLYRGGEMGRKFVQFHVEMLRTNCIFRRSTAATILRLAGLAGPHDVLVRYASAQDALYRQLPYAKEMQLFQKYFPVRLKEVADWIRKCQAR